MSATIVIPSTMRRDTVRPVVEARRGIGRRDGGRRGHPGRQRPRRGAPQPRLPLTAAPRPPALALDVADVLQHGAPLIRDPGPDPDLDKGGGICARRAEEVHAGVNEIWVEMREGRVPPEEEAIARRLREAGIPFRDGLQTMETIALGPVQPATASP